MGGPDRTAHLLYGKSVDVDVDRIGNVDIGVFAAAEAQFVLDEQQDEMTMIAAPRENAATATAAGFDDRGPFDGRVVSSAMFVLPVELGFVAYERVLRLPVPTALVTRSATQHAPFSLAALNDRHSWTA